MKPDMHLKHQCLSLNFVFYLFFCYWNLAAELFSQALLTDVLSPDQLYNRWFSSLLSDSPLHFKIQILLVKYK